MSVQASGSGAALRWLFLIQLLAMGAMEMSGPFWPLHLRDLGASQLALATMLVYCGPLAAAMCSAPLWGRLADRSGHKPMLLRALLALALTQLWIAQADSVAGVVAARIVQGALAGFIAAAQAYGACLAAPSMRGALMARLQMATAAGSIAGPVAGGLLFDLTGFRTLNLIAAVLCLACALAAMFALPSVRAPAQAVPQPSAPATVPAGGVALAGLLAAIVLVQAGKMAPTAFFGLYAETVLQAPGWLSGLCYGATALGLFIAAPLWARRFDRSSDARTLADIELVSWACVAVLALQAAGGGIALFMVARLLWGVCLGALLPVFYMLLSRHAEPAQQGRVLGLGNSAAKAGGLLGIAAGSLALAWLRPALLFWPVAAIYALAAIGLRLLRRQRDFSNFSTK